jgi:hypothetical protein
VIGQHHLGSRTHHGKFQPNAIQRHRARRSRDDEASGDEHQIQL